MESTVGPTELLKTGFTDKEHAGK